MIAFKNLLDLEKEYFVTAYGVTTGS